MVLSSNDLIPSRSSGVRRERSGIAGGRTGAADRGHGLAHAGQRHRSFGQPGRVSGHHRASGSGKSSLLYLLGLLDAPSDGEVIICGQPTSKLSEDDRAHVRLTKCRLCVSVSVSVSVSFLLPEFTSLEIVLLPMRELKAR